MEFYFATSDEKKTFRYTYDANVYHISYNITRIFATNSGEINPIYQ